MDEKIKYYAVKFRDVLESGISLNSNFDDSARDSDFRIVKTKFIDESDEDYEDHEYNEMVGDLGIGTDQEWDIECYCYRLFQAGAKWETIVSYPQFTSGSRQRNAFHMVQSKIKLLAARGERIPNKDRGGIMPIKDDFLCDMEWDDT